MTEETKPPEQAKKPLADIIAFPPPFRYTPEIVARMLFSEFDQIQALCCYVQYKNGKRVLAPSSNCGPEFMSQGAIEMMARAMPVRGTPPKEKA